MQQSVKLTESKLIGKQFISLSPRPRPKNADSFPQPDDSRDASLVEQENKSKLMNRDKTQNRDDSNRDEFSYQFRQYHEKPFLTVKICPETQISIMKVGEENLMRSDRKKKKIQVTRNIDESMRSSNRDYSEQSKKNQPNVWNPNRLRPFVYETPGQ